MPDVPSIRGALRKVLPHLLRAQEQNLNEAETVRRVVKVFAEVLGYDDMSEISREHLIKSKYVDIAIKLDGVVKLLVEVKSAATPLRDRHIEQARSYAAEGNIRWVVLTNGGAWTLYHLTFEEGIEYDCAFAIDLSKDDTQKAIAALALLHRKSVGRNVHEDFWEKKCALGPQSLGKALFTDSVLRPLRREIRRSEGISIDEEDLVAALKEMFSADAREQMGPIKVRRRRKKKIQRAAPELELQAETAPPVQSPRGEEAG